MKAFTKYLNEKTELISEMKVVAKFKNDEHMIKEVAIIFGILKFPVMDWAEETNEKSVEILYDMYENIADYIYAFDCKYSVYRPTRTKFSGSEAMETSLYNINKVLAGAMTKYAKGNAEAMKAVKELQKNSSLFYDALGEGE